MSGLYSSLTMAARALSAQQLGLEVTGNNIANVNTVGAPSTSPPSSRRAR